MVPRLLQQAETYVQQAQYREAADSLEQVFAYEQPNAATLTMYAYCLYELKRYEEMKDICEQLLALKPTHYIEVMELYIACLMQLKENMQVEKLIQTMKQDNVIPPDLQERFDRLQTINANAAQRKQQIEEQQSEEDLDNWYEPEVFVTLPINEQILIVQQLASRNIRPLIDELTQIVEHKKLHPFVQSLLLILFVEQEVSAQLEVTKFEQTAKIETAQLQLPTALPKFEMIAQQLIDYYDQQPSVLEMLELLLSKHAIVMYPFDYLHYNVDEIVEGYIAYIDRIFGREIDVQSDFQQFIERLEKLSEWL